MLWIFLSFVLFVTTRQGFPREMLSKGGKPLNLDTSPLVFSLVWMVDGGHNNRHFNTVNHIVSPLLYCGNPAHWLLATN